MSKTRGLFCVGFSLFLVGCDGLKKPSKQEQNSSSPEEKQSVTKQANAQGQQPAAAKKEADTGKDQAAPDKPKDANVVKNAAKTEGTAEGVKPDAKPEVGAKGDATATEGKGAEDVQGAKSDGSPEGKADAKAGEKAGAKADEKKPEAKTDDKTTEAKADDKKAETKLDEKKPEAKADDKTTEAKPEDKTLEKKPEAKAEEKAATTPEAKKEDKPEAKPDASAADAAAQASKETKAGDEKAKKTEESPKKTEEDAKKPAAKSDEATNEKPDEIVKKKIEELKVLTEKTCSKWINDNVATIVLQKMLFKHSLQKSEDPDEKYFNETFSDFIAANIVSFIPLIKDYTVEKVTLENTKKSSKSFSIVMKNNKSGESLPVVVITTTKHRIIDVTVQETSLVALLKSSVSEIEGPDKRAKWDKIVKKAAS
ncbi:MAG: hypothetical protein LBQ43_04060 [Holosporales bacterium]|jgi:hypothetical protein|nr:hypothetical protein [Holosporales bacterium]